jgi:predicted enzyme related to lactoylglutathione lyase
LELTFLYVPAPDLAAGAAFYRDVLGLEQAWRDGDATVAFWSPDRSVQLMVSTTDQPAGPMYLVDDLARWTAAHDGLPVRVPRAEIPYGAVTGFADPTGNVFYVFDQPGKPRP